MYLILLDKVQEEFFTFTKKKVYVNVGLEMSDFLNFTWKITCNNKYRNHVTFYLQLIYLQHTFQIA